ncbi:alpha/beta hydrolase [uncultured Cohaesibacter sp.]|uniref:alpha/beta fold hydrolase n=1 Tax=uncultured Cohaesibacter sp. TaxID=1002546 RepID=UPI0029305AD0|nr:alpha/beta hydrolase [uncultured Cohaesibacter sp.]
MSQSFANSQGSPKTIHTKAGPVETLMEGTGTECLFLHGGMGGYDQGGLLAAAALQKTQKTTRISLSRPGYLGTPLGRTKTPAAQADLYASLLDALEIDTVSCFAISAGGPSAIEFAARHKDRVKKLILISCCTTCLPVSNQIHVRLLMLRLFARMGFMTRKMEQKAKADPVAMAKRSIPDENLLKKTMENEEAWSLMQKQQLSIFNHMRKRLPGTINDTKLFAQDREASFSGIECPTLILHGTADRIVPHSHAELAHERIENAKLVSLKDADHVALFTHMKEVRNTISDLLSKRDIASHA